MTLFASIATIVPLLLTSYRKSVILEFAHDLSSIFDLSNKITVIY